MPLFRKIMMSIGLILLAIIIILVIAFYATNNITHVANEQLSALRAGDIAKAYSYTSRDFQQATSYNDFQSFVESYPILSTNEGVKFISHEVHNSMGTLEGYLFTKDGSKTDIEYRLTKEDGRWKVLGLSLDTNEAAVQTSANQSPALPLTQTYDNKDSRYSIKYPSNWEYDTSDRGTVIFSGKQGTPQYFSTVNIQTVLTKKMGGDYENVSQFIADIKRQALAQSSGTKFLENGPFTLTMHDGSKLQGEYLTFTYKFRGVIFKQWQIVVIRPDDQIFYAWAYTSPADQYATDEAIAKAMLASWIVY